MAPLFTVGSCTFGLLFSRPPYGLVMSDRNQPPFRCVTCDIEIAGLVTFHVGLPFCCAGCVANGPCTCSYDEPVEQATVVRHCLDIETAFTTVAAEPGGEEVLATRR